MIDKQASIDLSLEHIRLLASDYDATLTHQGHVPKETVEALRAAKQHGLKLGLITGREFDDLVKDFQHLELFDFVIAEDGGVLYLPASDALKPLVDPPPAAFIEALTERGIPFSRGRVILSTQRDYAEELASLITELKLTLHLTLNKGAAMCLPKGTDKGSGLMAGLETVGITRDAVVGFGDAENDIAFLRLCGVSVAVANALDAVKAQADIVLTQPGGAGVAAFIGEHLLT